MTDWLDKIEARALPRPTYMQGCDDADIRRLLRVARAAGALLDARDGNVAFKFGAGKEDWENLRAALADDGDTEA